MGKDVLYLCDKKACGEICPDSECNHTLNIEHAVNFEAVMDEETGDVLYYQEKERKAYTNSRGEGLWQPGDDDCKSPYTPTCPQGYDDCVCDPAYIQYWHPEWYKKLYGDLTPEEVSKQRCNIDDEYCYDDENM